MFIFVQLAIATEKQAEARRAKRDAEKEKERALTFKKKHGRAGGAAQPPPLPLLRAFSLRTIVPRASRSRCSLMSFLLRCPCCDTLLVTETSSGDSCSGTLDSC